MPPPVVAPSPPADCLTLLAAIDRLSAEEVELLLARGAAVPGVGQPSVRVGLTSSYSCPLWRAVRALAVKAAAGYDPALTGSERSACRILEALLAAGFSLTTWHCVAPPAFLQLRECHVHSTFDPAARDPLICRHVSAQVLLVARGGTLTWSEATHCQWPAGFRAAARTLLLAANRRPAAGSGRGNGSGRAAAAASLATLPTELLLHVLGLASAPLSAWMFKC